MRIRSAEIPKEITMNSINIIRLAVFVFATIGIVYVSRKSLSSLRTHGFYRFFVFECTLALVLLNIIHWFDDPLTIQQIFSWIILVISLFFIGQSFYMLWKHGGKRENRSATPNYEFENTSNLIKSGVYKYIRHPMYSSLLFLSIGAMLKNISIITLVLTACVLFFLILTGKTEEKENIAYFGKDYEEYMKETKMFVPFLF